MLQSTETNSASVQRTCPDCAATLARFATLSTDPGYICPTHGKFVVTGSSEAFGFWSAPTERQRRALRNARLTTPKPSPPVVILYA